MNSIFFFMASMFSALMINPTTNPQHPELGDVSWHRDFSKAIQLSEKADKPILILFQEVPGCATCRNYGHNVLTHPLIVEAIETEFIPLAIFNNKKGADEEVLKYYNEPSWNNPVVRIVKSNKQNIIPRIGRDYSQLGMVEGMVKALQNEGKAVPKYMDLLHQELMAEANGLEKVNFSMYCFWTGEKEIGQVDGVIHTRPGFMHGKEVVEVEYDPNIVTLKQLTRKAKSAKCASDVYVEHTHQFSDAQEVVGAGNVNTSADFRLDKEPKYYLSKTIYRHLPMTKLQAVKANALIGKQQSPNHLFSGRQLKKLETIQLSPKNNWPIAIEKDIMESWPAFEERFDEMKR